MKKFVFLVLFSMFLITNIFSSEFIRIVHINDFHGHILPELDNRGVEIGGISRIAKKISDIKKVFPDTLILDAGDFISGYLFANFDDGKTVSEIYKNIPFTAIVPGNHEFDYGFVKMKEKMEPFRDKIVLANVYENGKRVFNPYMTKKIKGMDVMIIGVTTPEITRFALGLKENNVKVTNPEDEIRKIINRNKNDVEVFIVLSHIGFEDDIKLAQEFEDLDIIIGGHTHTNVKVPPVFNKTIVNQTWEHGKRIGFLRVSFDENTGEFDYYNSDLLTPLRSWGQINSIEKTVQQARKNVVSMSKDIIADAKKGFISGKSSTRKGESELGNLICKSLKVKSGADFAIMNGGGIRANIDEGPVSVADIGKVLPFKNNAVVVEISGKDLKKIFNNSLQALKVPKLSGAFLQVDGLKVEYYLDKNIVKLSRVDGDLIIDNKLYTLALNDYILNGGDGYEFDNVKEIENYVTGKPLKDIVVDYVKDIEVLEPEKDGRIIIK